MVSNPAFQYRPAHAPRDFGTLVQSTFALWFSSLRFGFWPGMGYALLTQLAFVPWSWKTDAALDEGMAALASFEQTGTVSDAGMAAWTTDALYPKFYPDAWMVVFAIVANLLALVFMMVLMRRQGLLSRGVEEMPDRSVVVSINRFVPMLLATLGYFALNLIALAPVSIAWWLGSSTEVMTLLMLLLGGLLLCAVPLAWVSIAAALYSLPILLDGAGPLAALRESFRLVRDHWLICATLLTLTWLAWIGIYGTLSTVPMVLGGVIAYALNGFAGLLALDWLLWASITSAPLMALTLPLLTAGYVECFHELRLRAAASVNS